MSTEIRKLKKEGVQFYPQTHPQAVIGLVDELDNKLTKGEYDASTAVGMSDQLRGNVYAD